MFDYAIGKDLVSVDGVCRWLNKHPAKRLAGRRLLQSLLHERSDGSVAFRSKKEMSVRTWLLDSGLIGWTPNFLVAVGSNQTTEMDFAWPEQRVSLEVSLFYTHGSKQKQERDAERRRLLVMRGWRIVEANDIH